MVFVRFLHSPSHTPLTELEFSLEATIGEMKLRVEQWMATNGKSQGTDEGTVGVSMSGGCGLYINKWIYEGSLGGKTRQIEIDAGDDDTSLREMGIEDYTSIYLQGPMLDDFEGVGQALALINSALRQERSRHDKQVESIMSEMQQMRDQHQKDVADYKKEITHLHQAIADSEERQSQHINMLVSKQQQLTEEVNVTSTATAAASFLSAWPNMPMKALWESLVEPNSKTAEVPMAIISDHRCGVEKRSTAEEGKLMGMKEDFRGGATPIMLAVLAGRSDVVTALIPLVDVNATLSDTQTSVLHLAAEYGQAACIAAVFDDKSTWAFNSPLNDQGRTPLHLAALFGQLEAAKALVEKGRVSVGLKDSQGRTPLHLAASGNCFDVDERMVSYLVGKGAVVDAKDKSLQTPLMLAAACGNAFEIGELVRLGARVNADNGATTPLMIAAVSGKSESVEKLIALGAPIEAEDATGMTALHWAANCNNIINNVASIVALVAKGASVHVADRNGRTPLHVAAEKGNFETINVLVTAGSNLEVVDGRSRVPLQSFEAFGKQQCSSEDAAKIRSALGRLGFFKRHGLI